MGLTADGAVWLNGRPDGLELAGDEPASGMPAGVAGGADRVR